MLVVVAVVLGAVMAAVVTDMAQAAELRAPVVGTVAVVIVSLAAVVVVRVMVMATVLAAGAVAAAAAWPEMTTEGVTPRLMRMRMRRHRHGGGFWLAGMLRTMCSLMRISMRSLSTRARGWGPRQFFLVCR